MVLTKKTSASVKFLLSNSILKEILRRYGAVVRGQNAYVPPGARGKGTVSFITPPAAAPSSQTEPKGEIPKVSVNGPDGASIPNVQAPSPPSSKAASPTPAGATKVSSL